MEALEVNDFTKNESTASSNNSPNSQLPDIQIDDFIQGPSTEPSFTSSFTPTNPEPRELDPMKLPPKKLLNLVMRKGMVMFPDSSVITKCPCRSNAAACPLIPMPHPETGDSLMVCHGPSVQKKTSGGIIRSKKTSYHAGQSWGNCPYRPERLNEPPSYKSEEGSGIGEGWL